jgi:hypothetical protein
VAGAVPLFGHVVRAVVEHERRETRHELDRLAAMQEDVSVFACFDVDLDERERTYAEFEKRWAYAVALYAERLMRDNRLTDAEAWERAAGYLAWLRDKPPAERKLKLERAIVQLRSELDAARAAGLWVRELVGPADHVADVLERSFGTRTGEIEQSNDAT